ncbi:arginine--tRNA ligase [Pseudonocardia sp. CA-107938]|uniref:arginine--tRNA ligase n=1 Tax=Pseudonocardia sp. CA-107938 TaxID=3240021 RepID=UPI003D945C73
MNPTRIPLTSLAHAVELRVRRGIAAVLPEEEGADPVVRHSERADLQANGVLPVAKRYGIPPRELATQVAAALPADDLIAAVEPSGPGFLNITLTDAALMQQVAARAADPRLGAPTTTTATTVIDYSQPNIAKEMHVGHLRSTVVGDALARLLGHAGATVVRQNHLGDWGTNFGMLVQYLAEHPAPAGESISGLDALYRAARARFEADPGFADRSRAAVVALQAGEPGARSTWAAIVAESTAYFEEIYRRLDVLLEPADAVGESFYNADLAGIADDLEARGIAVESDGALCAFNDEDAAPLIVRKSDGGFGYAVTDLAAIRHRVQRLHADRILYVVDARQAQHFRMVFAVARRAGYLPLHVEAVHVAFGSVLGPDGRPFKTRAGETVRLLELLESAVAHARATVAERSPDLAPDELDRRAAEIGIGAVKFADLTTSRTRDYVFDLDRMLSLTGDTGVYLQYAHARALEDAYAEAEEGGDPDTINRVEAHAWLDGWSAREFRVQGFPRDLFLAMNGLHLQLAGQAGPEIGDVADAWDRVGSIAVPTLVLVGDLDDTEIPAAQHLGATIPGARLEILDGTGHLPHLEGHRRCLDLVTEFLSS